MPPCHTIYGNKQTGNGLNGHTLGNSAHVRAGAKHEATLASALGSGGGREGRRWAAGEGTNRGGASRAAPALSFFGRLSCAVL